GKSRGAAGGWRSCWSASWLTVVLPLALRGSGVEMGALRCPSLGLLPSMGQPAR
ncbi:hypothetical protein AAFF_G00151500, partial [Aldrovandia affinis]